MYCYICVVVSYSPEMIDFKQQSSNHNLEATCNANCQCPREIFRPVCGVNGVTYISPCHAGCQTLVKSNSTSISNTKPSGYFTKKVRQSEAKVHSYYLMIWNKYVITRAAMRRNVPQLRRSEVIDNMGWNDSKDTFNPIQ